ncbi:hypothetical protein PG994_008589 [Apiospora phragmitis]|uniref:Uncharacterized protein n=1 Tax=Apiospora phragmitis TaxID=2905665 RepID=A0ABR1UGW5_9PEZI
MKSGPWLYYHSEPVGGAGTDLDIPGELDLDVVCPSSTTNEDRKELFDSIGVTCASVTNVRNVLTKFYQGSFRLNLSQSAYYFHFLYLTHHQAITPPDHTSIRIMSDKAQFVIPTLCDNIYVRDENPYGPGQLLEPTPAGGLFGDGGPGFEVIYVHVNYLEHAPSPLNGGMESLKDWLHRHLNVRRYIPIADAEGKNLIGPMKVIGLHATAVLYKSLKLSWYYAKEGDETDLFELHGTYLPLDTLRGLCDRFPFNDEMFPFLRLETPLSDWTLPLEWKELDKIFHLGVKELDLVDFALDILIHLHTQNGSRFARWAKPDECVWQAPTGASTITLNSLPHLYSHHFRSEAGQLDNFFLDTLGIQRKCTWENIVDEIKAIKSVGNSDLDTVHRLYKFLYSSNLGPIPREDYGWLLPRRSSYMAARKASGTRRRSSCGPAPPESGRCLLSNPFMKTWKTFFVNLLGVETQTAKMVYEKPTAEETTRLPMEETKDTILAFSSLLASEGTFYDPDPVLQNKVFPVRLPGSGGRVLQNGKVGFAIWDRKPLGDAFLDQGKFLDLSMDLVRDLERFIEWAGLGNRYLLKAVKDFSAVNYSSTRVVTSPRLLVQSKAHALIRIAVTYNSPRVGNAHDQEAFYRYLRESETLETSKITSELHLNQDALLHICEDDSGLKIYIPEDEINQETCFRNKLPQRLCEWLMTDPDTQISNPPPAQAAREAVFPSPAGSLNIPVRPQQDFIAGGPYSLHAFGKLERDRMIGAAGELFISEVFELLSRLRMPTLPGFNIDNWKSTIRQYAANHPEYGDIRRLASPETSDITYNDTDGVLTNLLVAKGYMPTHISSGERIG